MKYDNTSKKFSLEQKEVQIIDTAIVELGGPFHSPFARHLQKYHLEEYDQIKKELVGVSTLAPENVQLVIDILQIFLIEPLESDWGTTYSNIKKQEIKDLLNELMNL